MKKQELVDKIEEAKGSGNHFDRLELWLSALTEFVLEQPKAPEVESKLPKKG